MGLACEGSWERRTDNAKTNAQGGGLAKGGGVPDILEGGENKNGGQYCNTTNGTKTEEGVRARTVNRFL